MRLSPSLSKVIILACFKKMLRVSELSCFAPVVISIIGLLEKCGVLSKKLSRTILSECSFWDL